jgi:hypothetical protein
MAYLDARRNVQGAGFNANGLPGGYCNQGGPTNGSYSGFTAAAGNAGGFGGPTANHSGHNHPAFGNPGGFGQTTASGEPSGNQSRGPSLGSGLPGGHGGGSGAGNNMSQHQTGTVDQNQGDSPAKQQGSLLMDTKPQVWPQPGSATNSAKIPATTLNVATAAPVKSDKPTTERYIRTAYRKELTAVVQMDEPTAEEICDMRTSA